MSHFVQWARRNLALIAIVAALSSLAASGLESLQIRILHGQQKQININAARTKINAEKNDCWSRVLDEAIAHAPLTPPERAQLGVDAHKCARLP